ncbi:MAG: hypothetical protein EOP84_02300 [Verrucomicrobiaceae bacterium]|nr:MAG: hypothetical protein EOP84_02300 [Verrucomicrobiaceae bacterium]
MPKLNKHQTETRLDLGIRETTKQAAARSEEHRQRVESQELLDGGDGSVTRAVLGESRTTFEQGQARTVNRILDGGSILTIFHEEAHGFRRRAHQNGSLTVADDIAILRAVDTVLAGKTTREGDKQLRLLPENFDTLSPKDQKTAIDEGISRLMEAEVLRTRKSGGVRELPAGIISKNLSALTRLAGDKSVGKFRAFIRAMRAHFGLAIDRASEIRRRLEDGTISREDYESYLKKLHGIGARQALDAETSSRATEFYTDSSLSTSAFSVGDPSRLSRPVPALEISGEILPGNRADWKNTVRQMIAEQLQRRSLDNRDTGQNIFFNSESRSQSVSKIRTEPAHRAALRIPSIVEDAIYIGHSPENKGKGDHVAGFDYFAIPLNLGGYEKIAWFNTKKRSGETVNKGQFYQFGLLEKEAARTSQSLAEEPRVTLPEGEHSNAGPARTVASFVEEVKGLLPSASSFLDDSNSFSLGPAAPRLSEQQAKQVEDLAFENAKRTRILNTDDITPLIPGYASAELLTRDGIFHPTASDITARVLKRMLDEPPTTGKILVVAGGNGAGKSLIAKKLSSEADFTYDINLSDFQHANFLQSQVNASGREMELIYVHRRFSGSFRNVIRRYLEDQLTSKARIVTLAHSVDAHLGGAAAILNLKNVPITIVDNDAKPGERRIISLEDFHQEYYNQTHETGGDAGREDAPIGTAGHSGSRRSSARGRGTDREGDGRNQAQERLEAEGRAIIERYRSDGFLTNAEARAFGGGRDLAIDHLPATGTTVDRGDPQGEIARLRGKQEHDNGRSAGTSEAQRILHEADSLVTWARENGRLIDTAKWEQHLESWSILASGSEHHVYLDKASGRVVKITQPPSFGAFGRSDSYLRILELNNSVFGDDIRLEGILTLGEGLHASPAIVTSQPFTQGNSPTLEEIANWMSSLGFEAQGRNVYINRALGIKVMDAHSGNIIKTRTGTLIPIDLLIHELNR